MKFGMTELGEELRHFAPTAFKVDDQYLLRLIGPQYILQSDVLRMYVCVRLIPTKILEGLLRNGRFKYQFTQSDCLWLSIYQYVTFTGSHQGHPGGIDVCTVMLKWG